MKTAGPSDEARLAQEIRNEHDLGYGDAQRAARIAIERFEGNGHLGALYIHASQLAVMVWDDRDGWNEQYARRRYEELKNG